MVMPCNYKPNERILRCIGYKCFILFFFYFYVLFLAGINISAYHFNLSTI